LRNEQTKNLHLVIKRILSIWTTLNIWLPFSSSWFLDYYYSYRYESALINLLKSWYSSRRWNTTSTTVLLPFRIQTYEYYPR
jgi:hypothetical protein